MIQNIGQAPIEAYTILGVSTSRDSDVKGVIGQFGSGNKLAINTLLRKKISPIIWIGLTRLSFFTKPAIIDDGLSQKAYESVHIKIEQFNNHGILLNTEEKGLGFSLEHGQKDWTSVWMAFREFIANALDRTTKQLGKDALWLTDELQVHIVDKEKIDGKEGYTRVFIPYIGDVVKCHSELSERFLHFGSPELLDKTFLPKVKAGPAKVYCKGVFIRVLGGEDSLFDYNIDNLELDECRNVDDWKAMYTITEYIANAPSNVIYDFLLSAKNDKMFAEHNWFGIDSRLDTPEKKKLWYEQFLLTYGDGVICESLEAVKRATDKIPIVLSYQQSRIKDILLTIGVPTAHALYGREVDYHILPATDAAIDMTNKVWTFFNEIGMTMGKVVKPKVVTFQCEDSSVLAYHKQGVIGYRQDLASDKSDILKRAAIEEMIHYLSKASDCTRDFQEFACQTIAKLV